MSTNAIWSDSRLDILKENYPILDNRRLGKLLGLSRSQIVSKANKLGLKKRTAQTIIYNGNGNFYKSCYMCGDLKHIDDFYSDSSKSTGLDSACKLCSFEKVKSNKALK